MKVKITVPGACVAKARPRFSNKTGRVFTPNNTHKYEKLVKECYGDNYYFDNEFIKIKIIVMMAIPKSYNKQKTKNALDGKIFPTKADLDNYVKTICDGLNGVAFRDDRYIYHLEAEKRFTEGEARTDIIIESGE